MQDFIFKLQNLEPYQRNRLVLGVIVGLIVLVILISLVGGLFGSETGNTDNGELRGTLVVWNIFDDRQTMQPIIQRYISQNPRVRIEYEQQDFNNYRNLVADALVSGEGPDVYAMHNNWLPLDIDRVVPMNEALPDADTAVLTSRYPDVFRFDFTRDEENPTTGEEETMVYALPLSIDTLALYYNVDYFNSNNIVSPPATWDEFVEASNTLRRVENDDVQLAGVAMGSPFNHEVNRATDILSALMIQGGAEMQDDFGSVRFDRPVERDGLTFYPGEEAMSFYTSFSNPNSENYTWPPDRQYSIDAFSEGYAAMMINYSHHRQTIRNLNPNLNFTVAPFPQPADSRTNINYASYWGFAVPRNSENAELAWDFINFLAQEENATIYLENSNRPPALRSLVQQQEDPEIGVFANQILTARSWRQPDAFAVEQSLENAINAVLNGTKTIRRAVRDAADEINFGVNQ